MKELTFKEFGECGVYRIGSKTDFTLTYVGSSKNIYSRLHSHLSSLRKNNHNNPLLQEFYNNCYPDDLMYEILWVCKKEELKRYENFFIKKYNSKFNIQSLGIPYPKHSEYKKIKQRRYRNQKLKKYEKLYGPPMEPNRTSPI